MDARQPPDLDARTRWVGPAALALLAFLFALGGRSAWAAWRMNQAHRQVARFLALASEQSSDCLCWQVAPPSGDASAGPDQAGRFSALIALRLGRYEEARTSLASSPGGAQDGTASFWAGEAAYCAGDRPAALATWRGTEAAARLAGLGWSCYSRAEYESSAEMFRLAVACASSPSAIWYLRLGDAERVLGRAEAALLAYREAIALAPENPRAYLLLGDTLRRQQQYDQAIGSLLVAVQRFPEDAGLLATLARTYADKGDLEAAVASYTAAITLKPDLASYHLQLGDVYLRQGRIGESRAEYQAALALDAENAQTRARLERLP